MSVVRCLPDLIASGAVSRETADEVGRLFDELARDYRRQFGDQTAEAMASDGAIKALERETFRKKRQRLLAVRAQARMTADMARYNGGGGGGGGPIDPNAAKAFFDRDGRAPYGNVEARRKAVRGAAHAMVGGLLERHRRDLIGRVQHKTELDEFGRAMFGDGAVPTPARELAEAAGSMMEMLRQRFNAAGGDIARLDRYGLPQTHDWRRVRESGYEAWRGFILGRNGEQGLLDRTRMIDERTGMPFSDQGLEAALRDVFETIRQDGVNKLTPGQMRGKALANRRQEHRFLHFRDYDAWAAYQERYGAGTAFDAVFGHVEAMSRDIALMEILGPNPEQSVRWLTDMIEQSAARDTSPDSKAVDRARAATKEIGRLYDEITGANNVPEKRGVALFFSGLRSVQTAAKLGSATLSATSDIGFQVVTRKFNGLPAIGVMGDYLKLLNPADPADRLFAIRAGLIAEEWSSIHSAQSRYLNEALTGEVSRRMAEGVLRGSGLSSFTQAGRWAFGMEFLHTLTVARERSWGALDPALRAAMQRYGWNEAGWERLRAAPLTDHKGTGWIIPSSLANRDDANRLMEMILTETDFAVPTADLRTRATINAFAQRGTFVGEIARSAFLFKSFGISVLNTHGRRIMEMTSFEDRLRYFAGLTLALTIGGAVAIQLKELSKGRDPRPMTDAKFATAALLQGGGFGIFGDFVSATENRFGGGFASTFAGPTVQSANNFAYLLSDGIGAVNPFSDAEARAKKAHAMKRDFTRVLRQEVPGSSLWMIRALYERAIIDQIEMAIDADYPSHFRTLERKAEDQGNAYWLQPGTLAPTRAPDFGNALAVWEDAE